MRNFCREGNKYGLLTAIKRIGVDGHGHPIFLFSCECGNSVFYVSHKATSGGARSCGCLKKAAAIRTGKNNATHGLSKTATYRSWIDMIRRCTKPGHERYSDYGARGISVCSRWLESFENFLTDMGIAPNGLTLDRIDNDGGYKPGNCRWATRLQQVHNRRNTPQQ